MEPLAVVALVLPLVLLQLTLLVVALRDLVRDDRSVRGGNKGIWALAIIFLQLVGPLLYFTIGRDDQ